MYFGDWHAAQPKKTGPLSEYAVFTQGDPMKPAAKGAVLRYVDAYVYLTLAANASTPSTTLNGKQQIWYFVSGAGTLTAGGDSVPVAVHTAVLVPANLAFTLKNSGTSMLAAYVITEPTPAGFQPRSKLVVKDAGSMPVTTTGENWSGIVQPIFTAADGLATIHHVEVVTLDAMTITRPYVGTSTSAEQLWMELSGTSIAFIGPYLRRQTPGMAFEHPPDNQAPTSSVNYSEDSQIKLLLVETDGK